MPVEFLQQEPSGGSGQITRLAMAYDGSGRRVSKTSMRKAGDGDWDTTLVTHYTGIGTEVREYKPTNFTRYTDSAGVEHCVSADPDYGGNASTACPLPDTVKVAVPLPQGLGRYALQDADRQAEEGSPQAFEWYLKNHLGSTMVVYGTGFPDPLGISPEGELRAAYDYRSFGEQLDLLVFTRKVTENFTGKEKDDETQLDYFGARYLDPMLGMWISVDPKRQFSSPYLYAGNGVNPIIGVDDDGRYFIHENSWGTYEIKTFSKGEAISGWLARDGTEIVLALIPFPFISSLYGEAKGYITQGKAGVAIATGENASVLALSLENKAAARYSSFLFALFDAKLGWDELMSKVDSPEFIDEFNKRMKSNGGEDYNSFKTKEEADAYAQEISKSIKENNQPSAEE